MELSKEEEQKFYEWGIKFYEMGWDAAFKNISQMGEFCKGIKVDAVREYILAQSKKED